MTFKNDENKPAVDRDLVSLEVALGELEYQLERLQRQINVLLEQNKALVRERNELTLLVHKTLAGLPDDYIRQ